MANINTIIKNIPVKVYNLIGIVKYYYSLLRRIYHIIIFEILKINKNIVL